MHFAAVGHGIAGPGEGILNDLLGCGAVLPAPEVGALAWLQFLVDVEEITFMMR
jgi:hypothetical protein